jgi:hypothetical protein
MSARTQSRRVELEGKDEGQNRLRRRRNSIRLKDFKVKKGEDEGSHEMMPVSEKNWSLTRLCKHSGADSSRAFRTPGDRSILSQWPHFSGQPQRIFTSGILSFQKSISGEAYGPLSFIFAHKVYNAINYLDRPKTLDLDLHNSILPPYIQTVLVTVGVRNYRQSTEPFPFQNPGVL